MLMMRIRRRGRNERFRADTRETRRLSSLTTIMCARRPNLAALLLMLLLFIVKRNTATSATSGLLPLPSFV